MYFQSVADTLRSIKRPGAFAAGGKCTKLPLPSISISGMSDSLLGLPLCGSQAKTLSEVCARAPYGKGTETIVDTTVRCTWQLDPKQFIINNPDWEESVTELVDKVKGELGCDSMKVQCELYKLLLYEPGGFFKLHQDTEKSKGMFGTMVIQLPSYYKGGQLFVHHKSQKKEFDFGGIDKSSDFYYAAFYADCLHEIKPVTEGYRLSLIYNLIYNGPADARPTPADYQLQVKAIVSAMKGWSNESNDDLPMMVYVLEHKYSQAGLSFDLLKGVDKGVAAVLMDACSEEAFDVFLCDINATQVWTAEEGFYGYGCYGAPEAEDIVDEDVTVKALRSLDGRCMKFSVNIINDYFVPDDFLEGDPDNEEYEGYTGNEGATLEKQYFFTALLLWPRKNRSKVLGVEQMIKLFMQKSPNEENLESTATEIIKGFEHDEAPVGVCHSFVKLLEGDLLKRAVGVISDRSKFNHDSIQDIVAFLSYLKTIGEEKAVEDGVHKVVVGLKSRWNLQVADSISLLKFLYGFDKPELVSEFLGVLVDSRNFSSEHLKNSSFCKEVVVSGSKYGWSLLKPFIHRALFANAEMSNKIELSGKFLCGLVAEINSEEQRVLCRELANKYVEVLVRENNLRKNPRDAKFVVSIIRCLMTLECNQALVTIIALFVKTPVRYPVVDTLAPALKDLGQSIKEFNAPLQTLLRYCITVVEVLVKKAPPPGWSQPTSFHCVCRDCKVVLSFLNDSKQQEIRLKMGKSRRAHVHQQLDAHGCDVTHTTEHIGNPHTLIIKKSKEKFIAQKKKETTALSCLRALSGTDSNGSSCKSSTGSPCTDEPLVKKQKCEIIDLTL